MATEWRKDEKGARLETRLGRRMWQSAKGDMMVVAYNKVIVAGRQRHRNV